VDTVFNQAAAVRAGERVLVHAAAGGVGLAAIQVLQGLGATVVATAGSPAKRALLRSLGVRHLGSSRDLSFVDAVAQSVGCVDVVLNSLTSAGVVAGNLALLRPGGRFVEIGKRDIWSAAAAAAERPDASFSLVAVDFMSEAGLHGAMQRLAAAAAAGRVSPLPAAVHDLRGVVSALRQMSQARHVGKVVVRNSAGGLAAAAAQQHPEGCVLVLGGTGTLGSLMVRWLAEQGVRHIPVASRSGKLSSSLAEALSGGAAAQAQVSVLQCDASSAADVQALLAGGPPLLAVLHAGGVLADATFANQTLRDLRAVSAPKASALRNLQQLMRLQPLATAVLFSSVASLLGSPGQANYSAANAALDAAAMRSQQAGAPVVSVQWGAWAGAGMAANDAQTAARVERTGMGLLSPEAGLAALEGVLAGLGAGAAGAAVPGEWLRRAASGSLLPRPVHPSWACIPAARQWQRAH
jgi:NADPH:quinone reductase-like Zn-dependent oxidoreductase